MMRVMRCAVASVIACTACGPQVIVGGDVTATTGTTQTGSPPMETSAASTGPSPLPTTTASEDDTSRDDHDDGTTSSGDPTCAFLCEPDGGSGEHECDLFAQNCPPGQKCMPWAKDGSNGYWNATRCSPIARDPKQVGEPCMVEGSPTSGIDNCDFGSMCWNVDETSVGVCEDMCTGSTDNPVCEAPSDGCAIFHGGLIALCLASCHPLLQDCIVRNEVCYPISNAFFCAPDGNRNFGSHGDQCGYINACYEGNACIDPAYFTDCPNLFGCCSTFCDVTDPNADAMCQMLDANQTCEPWYQPGNAPAGYANVGVCLIASALPGGG